MLTRFSLTRHDPTLDTVQIQLRDCSITEEEIAPGLTALYDNHPEAGQSPLAGLNIRQISRRRERLGHAYCRHLLVTLLLEDILTQEPGLQGILEPLVHLARNIEMTITFEDPSA